MLEIIKLLRLDKPTGIFLLFWPCAWGLAIGSSSTNDRNLFYYYLILFFLGSIFMRSAGCVYNDIIDRNIDAKVLRTKSRPIAIGSISTISGWGDYFVINLRFTNYIISV